jgi:hypothetical protein
MTKLKELEERLRGEPDNLGLRVMVAGALHEAGRRDDAVELYRSVAIAYRDQGRPQQAIMVCRSILELAPDHAASQELLAALIAAQPAPRASPPPGPPGPSIPRRAGSPGRAPSPSMRPSPMPLERPSPMPREPAGPRDRPSPSGRPRERLSPMPESGADRPSPAPLRPSPSWLPRPPTLEPDTTDAAEPVRRSSGDVTPLPVPLPHHEADPSGSLERISRSDLPPSLQAELAKAELASYPEIAGIAAAARQISASLIAASRLEQTEELDEGDLLPAGDTGKVRRRPARSTPSPSVPPPLPRPPTPPEDVAGDAAGDAAGDVAGDAIESATATVTVTDATIEAATGPTAADDDEPTLPPPPGRAGPSLLQPVRAAPPPPPQPGRAAPSGVLEDEKTEPRELPRARPPSIAPATAATGPLAGAFFAPLPPRNRAAVLQRFRRRIVPAGATVIRRGETGHGLVVVVRGRLELHAEREGGARVGLGAVDAGEYIGEASLLARVPAAVHVIAETDAELLVLAPDDFHDVVNAFPALRNELESVAARRAQAQQQ